MKVMKGNDQPSQVNINPDDMEDVLCAKCGSQTFTPVFLFKKLSAVLLPTGS